MARLKIELPQKFHFSADIPVRIGDVNYGGHVGNDSILAIIQEARVQLLTHYGYTELDVEGTGIIMVDAMVQYKSQIFYGDVLRIEIAINEFSRKSCALAYRLTNLKSGKEAARAKTTITFFDYQEKKPVNVPEKFRMIF